MANANLLGDITTEQEALATVRRDGWALHYITLNLRTAELCLEAVKKDR